MKTEKGTLKIVKNSFQVTVKTKKGTADLQVPDSARAFRAEDATAGMEVDIERDEKNRIVKVSIPGKPATTPARPAPPPSSRGKPPSKTGGSKQRRDQRHGQRHAGRGHQARATRDLPKASAKVVGLPFHNPYTFLPFPDKEPDRHPATPFSVAERSQTEEENRLTGVLELKVTTKVPLLTCHPTPKEKGGHKTYSALTVGPDVIVPATGVRGSLRTLVTILTGGTLGYMNPDAYLCQGRDLNLGPRGPNSPEGTPHNVFLAEVEQAGTALRSGKVRLGKTKLVRAEALARAYKSGHLPRGRKPLWAKLNERGEVVHVRDKRAKDTPWKVKLSGRPINPHGKREALFLPGEPTLTLPPSLWAAYSSRHAHGDHPELFRGDLVWLEPADPHAERIEKPEDIASIQWARWGRRGRPVKDHIPAAVHPDSLRNDGQVDEVTDLFGLVPDPGIANEKVRTPAFAARVRPENLVFFDARDKVQRQVLAPLQPPHPGCLAFYRDNQDADAISEQDMLRGYKVYRTQRSGDAEDPWRYSTQGVYDEKGGLQPEQQKVNKTVELLSAGVEGQLRIAFRSLTRRELALLLQACEVPWRLGGGKPLGLGLCDVEVTGLTDAYGAELEVQGWKDAVQDLQGRAQMWTASQEPVALLRYPRAVDSNRFRKTRGGHAWFIRHAKPRMVSRGGERVAGIESLHIGGPLRERAVSAGEEVDDQDPMVAGQVLPLFDPAEPAADVLYGYDGFGSEDARGPRHKRVFLEIEPFDPSKHVTGEERSEGSHGKGAKFNIEKKQRRRKHDGD